MYNPQSIEPKWQARWAELEVAKTVEDPNKPKIFIPAQFPYPSGEWLHAGHTKVYAAADIIARKKKLEGFSVLHPMGWDAFGLPAENFAIKHGVHPRVAIDKNIATFKAQLSRFGGMYDWDREINTTDADYYHWSQWIFVKLYNHFYDREMQRARPIEELAIPAGLTESAKKEYIDNHRLAFVDYKPINWCPNCKTGLANEDLEDGKCERCGSEIERKPMRQWVLRITEYGDRLVDGLRDLSWDNSMKELERDWIGRSEGCEFELRKDLTDWNLTPTLSTSGEGAETSPQPSPLVERELVEYPEIPGYVYELARDLRKQGTKTEEIMWEILRDRRFLDLKFRRQHPIARYIADFYCAEKNLIIELDWPVHNREDQAEYDAIRDEFIQNGWYAILRISNEEAFQDIDSVLQKIAKAITPLSTRGEGQGVRYKTPTISVYTTRVDTVYGMSYVVMAPDHPSVADFITDAQRAECDRYISETKAKTDLDRTELNKEKTGVFTGSYVINPFNGESVPLWIADYVLGSYGTGAVMAVPAHDERDFEFAKRYDLSIRQSIAPIFEGWGNGEWLPHQDVETRTTSWIAAVLLNQTWDKVLILDWKHSGKWKSFITGGIEGSETPLAAAIREIKEETWYQDFVFLEKQLIRKTNNYHPGKDVNYSSLAYGHLFQLKSDKRDVLVEEELLKHDFVWMDIQDIKGLLTFGDHKILVEHFLEKEKAITDEGVLVNSWEFDRLISSEARTKLTEKATAEWFGRKKTNYKLRDWVFSRQRYWGEPIPMIHCEDHGFVAMREEELPLRLPEVENYQPTGTEEGPLANIEEWINTTCPICGKPAKRESNTMPQWAGSSWYWLRYMDPHNTKELVSKERENYWKAVDIYIGGVEHVTRHMIYARFWNMFLYDIGVVSVQEPFPRFQQIGLVLAEDGRKMSKRWGNIINPTDIMNEHGADTLRTYQMFMGPYDQSVAWNSNALKWVERFLERVEKLSGRVQSGYEDDAKIITLLHKTIKKVSEDIDGFKFNTAVSALMILSNALEERTTISAETFETFLLILAPFAPHLADELCERLGHKTSLFVESHWPEYDIEKCVDDEITIAVQINGKLRGSYTFLPGVSQEEVSIIVQEKEEIAKWIEWKEIVREIFVPNKLINIVVKDQ